MGGWAWRAVQENLRALSKLAHVAPRIQTGCVFVDLVGD